MAGLRDRVKPLDDRLRVRVRAALCDAIEYAAQLCDVPLALVALMDRGTVWFTALARMEEDETSRCGQLCMQSIMRQEPLVVDDTLLDERFATNPLVVRAPAIRFFAGFPILAEGQQAIGSLNVLDLRPRQLTDEQVRGLQTLGRLLAVQLDILRSAVSEADLEDEVLGSSEPGGSWARAPDADRRGGSGM